MLTPNRRTFLRTAAAAIASFLLPRSLRAEGGPVLWFLHTPTGKSWAVDDPVAWCLENARQPILERARERLVTLDAANPQRVVRLVVLRPFFKQHGLARHHVAVVLLDRKREVTTLQTRCDFLYGERLTEGFPLRVYLEKWRRRATEEPDDWTSAPCSGSNYCWEGVEQGF